jgi:hypothetical protein
MVRSGRQREGFRFNVYKCPAERTYMAVEVGGLRLLQISEEPPDPWRKMPLEQLAIGDRQNREMPAQQAGHDLA